MLFASAVIDYDYIMGLIAKMTRQKPGKMTMSRDQLIGLIRSDARFMDEGEEIADYIRSLPEDQPMNENEVRTGFERFKEENHTREIEDIAHHHELSPQALQGFVNEILRRRVFDGDALTALFAHRNLGWKGRTQAELALMDALVPLLKKRTQGREISGLAPYEQRGTI